MSHVEPKNRKQFPKFDRKPGVTYVRCEHLRSRNQLEEMRNQWIGENTRMILCPICARVVAGEWLGELMAHIRFNDPEVAAVLAEAAPTAYPELRVDERVIGIPLASRDDGETPIFQRIATGSSWLRKVWRRLFE